MHHAYILVYFVRVVVRLWRGTRGTMSDMGVTFCAHCPQLVRHVAPSVWASILNNLASSMLG